MKCLPATKLPESHGVGIHDWHAEILAIRTFNRYLLDECSRLQHPAIRDLLIVKDHSNNTEPSTGKPFGINPHVKLHMYCSEAPCGDASMELTMAAQDDASPWEQPESMPQDSSELPGRAYFSQLGIVRRKPARGDAQPTLSKSCSDKLSLKQCTSLLSSLTSLFIDVENAYIDTLVLPESRFSETACQRAFSATGRMSNLVNKQWGEGYAFRPFKVETTSVEFEYSKLAVKARSDRISASNIAAAWSLSGIEESILGGVLQGRKPFNAKGASAMSRKLMWSAASDLAGKIPEYRHISEDLSSQTYKEVKDGPLLAARRKVKADVRDTALSGWTRNDGDETFTK